MQADSSGEWANELAVLNFPDPCAAISCQPEDSVITWRRIGSAREVALAFRSAEGCLQVWEDVQALQSLVLRHHMSPARPRLLSPRAQQGPLEDGFKGLMPLNEEAEGNVEPELVARVQQEVRDLMGVELEDLLNPSKVVNLEREKIVKGRELASCTDAEVRAELEARLEKIDGDLMGPTDETING